MRHIAIGGMSALLLLVGCVHEKPAAQRPAPTPAAPQTAPAPVPAAPTQPAPAPSEAGASRASAAGSAAATGTAGATGSGSAKTKVPGRGESAAASAPRAAPPSTASAGTTAGGTATRPAPAPAPALDLTSLEQRLRDTRAIGVFTKLSLKNQVDDLLGEFRTFHRRQGALTVAGLRQKYDLLLLKVLSLLQDGDPPLAAAISSSREAIWAMLIDPQKFEKLARI
jgi:hypothetical protein